METYYLETDLEKISAQSELRKDENYRFKAFLKKRNGYKTDLLVHQLNETISPRINCTVCGNCCKNLSPYLNDDDLLRLAQVNKVSVEAILSSLTEKDEAGISFKHTPCAFLKENKCSIYNHRPGACASFPHLHKSNITTGLRRLIDNYSICPIIFNVIERLKIETGFDRNND